MSIHTDIARMAQDLNARDELIQQFREASQKDTARRDEICKQLEKYFARRSDWQKRHGASYSWATTRGLIQPINCKGYRNGKRVEPRDVKSGLVKKAEGRDRLHDYAMRNNHTTAQEIAAGEVYRKQLEVGRTAEAALNCAIEYLQAKNMSLAA